jgi:hypothetical protein
MVILGVLGLFLVLGARGIKSIAIGSVEERETGIWFEVRTTGKGLSSFSGDIDIIVEIRDTTTRLMEGGGNTSVEVWRTLLTTSVRVRNDYGAEEVPYTQFLQGNGDYRVIASADGKRSDTSFLVSNLVTSLDVGWSTVMPDPSKPEYFVMVDITYIAGSQPPRNSKNPSSFFLEGEVLSPEGRSPLEGLNTDIYTVQKAVKHTKKGEYSLVATLTNLDCAEGAPGRLVSISNERFEYDSPPFADAGEDVTVKLQNGVAIVDFNGGLSWDDGSIIEYYWDFDDSTTQTLGKPFITHAYSSPGNYTVTLSVKDDEGQSSVQDAMVSSLIVTVEE